ncbi:hypothetical protein MINTM008_53340 [Mycobacterium intracellulare]|uniref:Uncharacterized protein n=1 Tax=Mycobacterium paraintracellulare TaxID=1138383 RepID=A0ABN6APV2_9MYCO|nr:hypothetical protein MPRI_17270 [Mycobacterium paraintracellulare]BCO49393.1 hypothetical protein MINTM002_50670 [Mycobacterium intracellulare]BCO44187.1 hypothetical protein MINTM001_53260 [Mycobacterium paraintracellulare]BCO65173.1 hypothetical protein MINTM006_51230 [Mycobacterium intracellulare]BCO70522.1 hypothetical protein MINTM007_51330 [Mycobacterium intracellulare]
MKAVAPRIPASTASTQDNRDSLLLISFGTRTWFQTAAARAAHAACRRATAPGYAALAIATQTAVRRAMERNGIGSQPGRCRAS